MSQLNHLPKFACLLTLLTACPLDNNNDTDSSTDISTSEGTDGASSTSSPTPPTSTTDGSSGEVDSTGTTDATSSSGNTPDLDCFDLSEILSDPNVLNTKCEAHPWERKPECQNSGTPPMPTCQEMMQIIAEHPGCEEIDLCDYIVCADALAMADCGTRPSVCDPIVQCLGMPAPLTSLERLFYKFLQLFLEPNV